MIIYINGGTHAYQGHKSITIMHTILIRNNVYVYNVLGISLNRTTVTAYHNHIRFLCRIVFEDSEFLKLWKKTLFHVGIRPYYLAINWAIYGAMCICLIGDCRRAVKISTRQIQMRSWLLKGMGAGTLIGLLHVTPKPHLQVIRLLQTNPF